MMSHDSSETMINSAYDALLRRQPKPEELERWCRAIELGRSFYDIFAFIRSSEEYGRKRGVETAYPPGHYYSPVVDPSTVASYVSDQRSLRPADVSGIFLPTEAMLLFWKSKLSIIQGTRFPDGPDARSRFHYNNGSFPFGDAIMLRAIIAHFRPRRIVEIGSGYTTACTLDTAEELGLTGIAITCIEPYADRLRTLVRPDDWARLKLIETTVQAVDPAIFDDLGAGDILFVDSTHVVKTGSDVHFEIFHILPRLKPGVIIHFHDVPYPFEYPDSWIFSANLSWNEAYFLRAFLMYNDSFKILMWNSLLARVHTRTITEDFPLFMANPGSSIWIEKQPAANSTTP